MNSRKNSINENSPNLTILHRIEIGTGKILILLIVNVELRINQDILVHIVWMHLLWLYILFGIVRALKKLH